MNTHEYVLNDGNKSVQVLTRVLLIGWVKLGETLLYCDYCERLAFINSHNWLIYFDMHLRNI